ncbi:hypothetical protein [Paenibacillus eucommiae]|uniref:Uncharacterized protein n=1 Tax=Paenibacillus eucommiae TaxID=1355755 RepID=A0ABS4IRP5_9BACL|nr:hypothetical protein [Paenibacillus eucommiae]MBP1990208.1 hypothetical protein [Paenibacillus eucommiae]
MATVSTTLQLFDSFTSTLTHVNNAMEKATQAAAKLKQELNSTMTFRIDVSAASQDLQQIHDKIITMTRSSTVVELDLNVSPALQAVTSLQEQLGTMTVNLDLQPLPGGGSGAEETGSFLSNLKSIASEYLTIANAQKLLGATIGGAMEQQKMLDMFIARTGDAQIGTAMFDKFKQDALAAGQDVNETLKSTMSFFSKTQNTDQLTKLNSFVSRMNAFDTEGNGIEGAASALREAMSGDAGSLADSFGISKADISGLNIEELGTSGDMEGFIQAFDTLLEKQNMGQAAFDTMMATPAKQMDMLQNNFSSAMADAGSAALQALTPLITMLNTAFKAGKFQPFFDNLSIGLRLVANLFVGLVNGVLWFSNVVQTYWPIAGSILAGIAALIALIVIPQLWAMVPPLWSAAAAWLAINWPILLVAAAIGILVFILYECGVTFSEVIGFIAGMFMVLIGVLWNQIAYIWNVFASFAEFLINLFIDPTYAIKKLFYDLAMTFGGQVYNMLRSGEAFAGGFMKMVLDAINGILKGFNWLSQKIYDLIGLDMGHVDMFNTDNIHSMSDKVKDIMDQLEKPTSVKDVFSIDRMDTKNLKNEFDYGFGKGAGLVNGLNQKLPKAKGKELESDSNMWSAGAGAASTAGAAGTAATDAIGAATAGVKGNIPNIDRVGEVGSINDSVDINSEDLKVMRELTEMKNVQNFVTLTPTVQLTTGNINTPTDVDTIVTRIKEVMTQEITNSAQGVYA